MQPAMQPKMEKTKRKLPLTTKYWAPSFLQASWFWTPTSIMAILIAKFTKDTIGPPNAPNEGLKRRQLWFVRNIWIFMLKILILTHFQTYWILCFFPRIHWIDQESQDNWLFIFMKKKSRFSRIWNPDLSRGARLRGGNSPFFFFDSLNSTQDTTFRDCTKSWVKEIGRSKFKMKWACVKKGCESL